LNKANKEIRKINFNLSQVISSGDTHIDLQPDSIFEAEAIENTPMFFKVNVRGLPAPVRINLEYVSQGDLRVFASKNHRYPDIKQY
jgi:hypothetical protein